MEPLKAVRSADPSFEPVTRAEAKAHLAIPSANTDHDSRVDRLITAARYLIEHDTSVVCATGTYTIKMDDWPCCDEIELPIRPVTSITSITYTTSAGTVATWSSSEYSLNSYEAMPEIQLGYTYVWPTNRGHENDITITVVAGYASAGAIPANIREAVLLKVEELFLGPDDSLDQAYEKLSRRLMRVSYP